MRMKFIAILFIGLLSTFGINAQSIIRKSEKMKPEWLASKLPTSKSETFYYQIVESNNEDLNDARSACLTGLSTYIEQSNSIVGAGKSNVEFGTEGEYEKYTFSYKIQGQSVYITSRKIDEYWEYVSYKNGKHEYRLFTLFAVAKKNAVPQFDEVRFSYKYGARGMLRSMIIPGWGQMYKGSTLKGSFILGGEVALAVGIVYTENERANYRKKIKQTQNSDHILTYSNKADNLETARNICIGAAAALYVYNVVDAIAADGRKRTLSKKASDLSFVPIVSPDFSGVYLSYKF